MSHQIEIEGHCLCGAVRWASSGKPTWSALCHCESCRRATSAPVVSYVGVLRDGFRWTGKAPASYASSPGISRLFCPTCGSPMAFVGEPYPNEVFLYSGTIDDPAGFAPDMHVHYAERLPWLHIEDDLPRLSGFNEGARS